MRSVARIFLTLVIVAGAAFGGLKLWNYYMYSAWTRDGRIEADVVSIAPDVSGFVHELRVKDNQFVHKGDVLLVLDQDRYKLALATAAANVEARRASMAMQQHMAERREKLTTLSTSIEEK